MERIFHKPYMNKDAYTIVESWESRMMKPLNLIRMYTKRDIDVFGNRSCFLDTKSAGFRKYTKG
jgi:hypothetical protein